MKKLTLSVIIPNYNNQNYLKQCLESVINQTFEIKEIIIYDDYSTDGSRNILKVYEKKYAIVKVIYSNNNVGVSVARHTAIMEATSDYVTMLDADDFFYDKDKLKKEMKVAQEWYENTGRKIIVFSQTIDVDINGVPIKAVKYRNLNNNERFKIMTRMYGRYMPRDYCFPRKLYFECGGYKKGLSLYEDWDLNMRMLTLTKFKYSNWYGTAYRHKDNGLSSVNYKCHYETKKKIFRSYRYNFVVKMIFWLLLNAAYMKNIIKQLSINRRRIQE